MTPPKPSNSSQPPKIALPSSNDVVSSASFAFAFSKSLLSCASWSSRDCLSITKLCAAFDSEWRVSPSSIWASSRRSLSTSTMFELWLQYAAATGSDNASTSSLPDCLFCTSATNNAWRHWRRLPHRPQQWEVPSRCSCSACPYPSSKIQGFWRVSTIFTRTASDLLRSFDSLSLSQRSRPWQHRPE